MNREHLHAEGVGGFDGSGDGIRDVVELKIEPDPGASGQNCPHNFRAFGRVKLEADFEKRNVATELLHELEGPFP